MSEPITWTDETRRLRDLKPQEDNPREIKREQAERLVKSWHKFGQPDVISINPDNTILNGHQRYHVWGAAYGMDFEVAVRVASRQFTRREWQEYTVVSHEGAVGGWNWDGLAEWEGVGVEDLVDWGFDEATLLGGWGDTSTDRDGQAVSSTWDQVNESQNDKVIIGEIETRLPVETIAALSLCLSTEYEMERAPYFETLNTVILSGVKGFENRSS